MFSSQGARQLGLITIVPNFESDVPEASDSSEDDECPPPLPPPRTESLAKKESEDEEEVLEAWSGKKVVITDAEPYNSVYSNHKPLSNGAVNGDTDVSGASSNSSSVSAEASPNKCILTSGKLEQRKRWVIMFCCEVANKTCIPGKWSCEGGRRRKRKYLQRIR